MRTSKKTNPTKKSTRGDAFDDVLPAMTEGQRKIFDAAIDEFAAHGYASSSTLGIAQRAGVSEALIFKYFKNKATLLGQVVLPILAAAIVPLAIRGMKHIANTAHETLEEFLCALAKERLAFAKRHRKHLRILLQELPLNESLRTRVIKVMQADLFPAMEDKIRFFQSQGSIRRMPPKQVLSFLLPHIAAFILGRIMLGLEFETEEADTATWVKLLVHGIHPPTTHTTRNKKKTRKKQ